MCQFLHFFVRSREFFVIAKLFRVHGAEDEEGQCTRRNSCRWRDVGAIRQRYLALTCLHVQREGTVVPRGDGIRDGESNFSFTFLP